MPRPGATKRIVAEAKRRGKLMSANDMGFVPDTYEPNLREDKDDKPIPPEMRAKRLPPAIGLSEHLYELDDEDLRLDKYSKYSKDGKGKGGRAKMDKETVLRNDPTRGRQILDIYEDSPNGYNLNRGAPTEFQEAVKFYSFQLRKFTLEYPEENGILNFILGKLFYGQFFIIKDTNDKAEKLENAIFHFNKARDVLRYDSHPMMFGVIGILLAQCFRIRASLINSRSILANRGTADECIMNGLEIALDCCPIFRVSPKQSTEYALCSIEIGYLYFVKTELQTHNVHDKENDDMIRELAITNFERGISLIQSMETITSENKPNTWDPRDVATYPRHIRLLMQSKGLNRLEGLANYLLGRVYQDWGIDYIEKQKQAYEYYSNAIKPPLLGAHSSTFEWGDAHHRLALMILRYPELVDPEFDRDLILTNNSNINSDLHYETAIGHLKLALRCSELGSARLMDVHFHLAHCLLSRLQRITDSIPTGQSLSRVLMETDGLEIMKTIEHHLREALARVTPASTQTTQDAYVYYFSSLKLAELRLLEAAGKQDISAWEREALFFEAIGFVIDALHSRPLADNFDLHYVAMVQMSQMLTAGKKYFAATKCLSKLVMVLSSIVNRVHFSQLNMHQKLIDECKKQVSLAIHNSSKFGFFVKKHLGSIQITESVTKGYALWSFEEDIETLIDKVTGSSTESQEKSSTPMPPKHMPLPSNLVRKNTSKNMLGMQSSLSAIHEHGSSKELASALAKPPVGVVPLAAMGHVPEDEVLESLVSKGVRKSPYEVRRRMRVAQQEELMHKSALDAIAAAKETSQFLMTNKNLNTGKTKKNDKKGNSDESSSRKKNVSKENNNSNNNIDTVPEEQWSDDSDENDENNENDNQPISSMARPTKSIKASEMAAKSKELAKQAAKSKEMSMGKSAVEDLKSELEEREKKSSKKRTSFMSALANMFNVKSLFSHTSAIAVLPSKQSNKLKEKEKVRWAEMWASLECYFAFNLLSRQSRLLLQCRVRDLQLLTGQRAQHVIKSLPLDLKRRYKTLTRDLMHGCKELVMPMHSLRELSHRSFVELKTLFRSHSKAYRAMAEFESFLRDQVMKEDQFLPMVHVCQTLTRDFLEFDRNLLNHEALQESIKNEELHMMEEINRRNDIAGLRYTKSGLSASGNLGHNASFNIRTNSSFINSIPQQMPQQAHPKVPLLIPKNGSSKDLRENTAESGEEKGTNTTKKSRKEEEDQENRVGMMTHTLSATMDGTNLLGGNRELFQKYLNDKECILLWHLPVVASHSIQLILIWRDQSLSTLASKKIEIPKDKDLSKMTAEELQELTKNIAEGNINSSESVTTGGTVNNHISSKVSDDSDEEVAEVDQDNIDLHLAATPVKVAPGSGGNNKSPEEGKKKSNKNGANQAGDANGKGSKGGKYSSNKREEDAIQGIVMEIAKSDVDSGQIQFLINSWLDAVATRPSAKRLPKCQDVLHSLSCALGITEILTMIPAKIDTLIICCPPEMMAIPFHLLLIEVLAKEIDELKLTDPETLQKSMSSANFKEDLKGIGRSFVGDPNRNSFASSIPEEGEVPMAVVHLIEKYNVFFGPSLSLFELSNVYAEKLKHSPGLHRMCCLDGDYFHNNNVEVNKKNVNQKKGGIRSTELEVGVVSNTWSGDPTDYHVIMGKRALPNRVTTAEKFKRSAFQQLERRVERRKEWNKMKEKELRELAEKEKKSNERYGKSRFIDVSAQLKAVADEFDSDYTEYDSEDEENQIQDRKALFTCRILHVACQKRDVDLTKKTCGIVLPIEDFFKEETHLFDERFPNGVDPNFPLKFSASLAKPVDNKDHLNSRDIANQLYLRNCGLAVLSRFSLCDDVSQGSHVEISTAFVEAIMLSGATSVILPLWSAISSGHATLAHHVLLIRFYSELPTHCAHPRSIALSLRRAMLWLRATTADDVIAYLHRAPVNAKIKKELIDEMESYVAASLTSNPANFVNYNNNNQSFYGSFYVQGTGAINAVNASTNNMAVDGKAALEAMNKDLPRVESHQAMDLDAELKKANHSGSGASTAGNFPLSPVAPGTKGNRVGGDRKFFTHFMHWGFFIGMGAMGNVHHPKLLSDEGILAHDAPVNPHKKNFLKRFGSSAIDPSDVHKAPVDLEPDNPEFEIELLKMEGNHEEAEAMKTAMKIQRREKIQKKIKYAKEAAARAKQVLVDSLDAVDKALLVQDSDSISVSDESDSNRRLDSITKKKSGKNEKDHEKLSAKRGFEKYLMKHTSILKKNKKIDPLERVRFHFGMGGTPLQGDKPVGTGSEKTGGDDDDGDNEGDDASKKSNRLMKKKNKSKRAANESEDPDAYFDNGDPGYWEKSPREETMERDYKEKTKKPLFVKGSKSAENENTDENDGNVGDNFSDMGLSSDGLSEDTENEDQSEHIKALKRKAKLQALKIRRQVKEIKKEVRSYSEAAKVAQKMLQKLPRTSLLGGTVADSNANSSTANTSKVSSTSVNGITKKDEGCVIA